MKITCCACGRVVLEVSRDWTSGRVVCSSCRSRLRLTPWLPPERATQLDHLRRWIEEQKPGTLKKACDER